jgi:DNA ligase D-like protein (predicted ligase)
MLPDTIKPMLATMAQPFDSPEYTYEIKWDGYRCLTYLAEETRIQSRNHKDISQVFPELLDLHRKVKSSDCLLDGEIVALRDNRPSFLELQKRGQLRNPQHIKAAIHSIPVVYVAFDILYFEGKPVLGEPIEKRRSLLMECFNGIEELIVANFVENQGIAYFNTIVELELEGVIAKQKGSLYFPGKRVKNWLKFKRKKLGNFIICGYSINPTHRSDLSALILGAYEQAQLKPFGLVGTGFTQDELDSLYRELKKITSLICPFTGTELRQQNVYWTNPIIVCEIEYLELTDDHSLRHPSFKRFRFDVNPTDCRFD